MQNSKNMRKRATAAVGVATAAALMVGSLAFFTDRATLTGKTEAGKLAVGITAAKMTDGGDFSEQLQNSNFVNTDIQNLNPGDTREIAYTINNLQNKAMRTNDTITLTVTPDTAMVADAGTSVDDMSAAFVADKSAIHLVTGTPGQADKTFQVGTTDSDTATVKFDKGGLSLVRSYVKTNDDSTKSIVLIYQGTEVNISGTGTNAEVMADDRDGTTGWVKENETSVNRSYTLYFDKDAGNAWQGAKVNLNAQIDAVQYANTNAGDATMTVTAETNTIEQHGANNVDIITEKVKSDEHGKAK